MSRLTLHAGDCLDIMPSLAAESVDAIVTDPPYGLSFMGKDWDHGVPGGRSWRLALHVAKPGAHLVAFGGTRTYHRLTSAIEDAGWEIRDCLMWLYGSGFPKSLDVSKAIDKAAGAEREVIGSKVGMPGYSLRANDTDDHDRGAYGKFTDASAECAITAPATDAARQWAGWGTALKPAWEPIILARKPLHGTVAANVQTHGTGAINVDGCRIGHASEADRRESTAKNQHATFGSKPPANDVFGAGMGSRTDYNPTGRWPANLLLDDATLLGEQARFFYCAKASRKDRGPDNTHPTVKPTDLMRWLVRLVTPPGGVVLDPFMGSGSTGKAALAEGMAFIGIEREQAYFAIAEARLRAA